MVISGSDKQTTLWNKDGVLLGPVQTMNDWVWSVAVNPINHKIFAGGNNGEINMAQVDFNTIHGLF